MTTAAQIIEAESFAKKQREKLARKFVLVDAATGEEISLPATRKCWDGYEITIKEFQASGSHGMEGLIVTTMNEEYVPSVCGAKIVEAA